MAAPKVSVIIPNYNYSRYVGETIDSALAQTYDNIEIIVVDDGSTDDSRTVLDRYGDYIRCIFQRNQGVAAARNNGVAASSGEFVAFLDADDEWLPQKVERQVAMHRSDKSLGLVHVGVDEIDADGNSLRHRLEGSTGDARHELLMLGSKGVLGGGSGLMVPRAVFDQIGGFDTRLSTSADWDLFYQIGSRFPVGFVPEILLRYRIHHANMHGNVKMMEHDMTIAFDKAFGNTVTAASRAAFGNLYKILAGSYFRARKYGPFVRTAFRSLNYEPRNVGYFFKFPLRRLRRTNSDGTER